MLEDTEAPGGSVERLQGLPEKSSIPWFAIERTLVVLGGVAWGFWHGGEDVGTDLVLYWVLWTGGLGALGCAVAAGHPLSILGASVAPPPPPLLPALPSGTVSALIESWVPNPPPTAFIALRNDLHTIRGWLPPLVAGGL